MADYLKHHGFTKGPPDLERGRTGPPCEVCGGPMQVGQRRRHYACSPRLECCGAFSDLVPDIAQHRADHAEADADPHRMRQRPDWDPGPRS